MPRLHTHSDGTQSYKRERAADCSSCGAAKPPTRMSAFSDKCLDCERGKPVYELVSDAKKRAAKSGVGWDIDTEFVQGLILKQKGSCALTGIQFSDVAIPGGRVKRPWQPSIDRIDSSKGYTRGNVQMVCCVVNLSKNEFPISIFDEMCKMRSSHLTAHA